MSAMGNLRGYLASNGLDPKNFEISATIALPKTYSKGDCDYYCPEVTAIELVSDATTHVIAASRAFDEVARAVHDSDDIPFQTRILPKGSDHSFPTAQVVLPLDLTIQRAEAEWELQDALHDDSEGSEERFQDARWKVFTLTDVFAKKPCSREVFNTLSLEMERLKDPSRFREFYDAWHNADEGVVVNGEIAANVQELVKRTVEQLLDSDNTVREVKQVICGSFKVHPRHRPLFDAVVDDIMASRSPTFSR